MRKILLPLISFAVLSSCGEDKKTQDPMVKTTTSDKATTENKPMQAEFADAKYTDIGKQMLQQMEAGNMDQWTANFADNGVFQWSSGDSLAGKQAIADYWKPRRSNVIETIKFSNDIWLPMKINTPQRGPDMPGIWLLSWHQVNVKYKTGKELQFWVHTDYHFNASDKIDRAIQYIDMAPIKAALAK